MDQILVSQLAQNWPNKVIPAFGYHPWFAHQFYIGETIVSKDEHYKSIFNGQTYDLADLPDPLPLREILAELRKNLSVHPQAMVGEIGLDKSFRVNRHSRNPLTLPFAHQLAICEAQLEMAIELRRNVSLHVVRAPQAIVDLLNKLKAKHAAAFEGISVDLHSCSLSVDTWKTLQKRHSNLFMSFSTAINGRSDNYEMLIQAADPSRILIESDLNEVSECTLRTWSMFCNIAAIKGWKVEDRLWAGGEPEKEWGVIRRIEANWLAFRGGR